MNTTTPELTTADSLGNAPLQGVTDAAFNSTNIPTPALSLGLAGLLPFVASAVLMWTLDGPDAFFAERALLLYGAVILSFLGGIRWGTAMLNGAAMQWHPLIISVIPSLLAWGALLLDSRYAALILIVGFAGQWLHDINGVSERKLPAWFSRLRTLLTVGAVVSLLVGFIATFS